MAHLEAKRSLQSITFKCQKKIKRWKEGGRREGRREEESGDIEAAGRSSTILKLVFQGYHDIMKALS